MTNHKIYKADSVIIEWDQPINSNGILSHYLIEWTNGNETRAMNVSFHDGQKNRFKFPPTNDRERFNVSIRAVSNFGLGIPIYVNLQSLNNFQQIDNPNESSAQRHDPRLGIIIGVLLSIVCVFICMLIIIRHRQCVKNRPPTGLNGDVVQRQFHTRTTNTASFYNPTTGIVTRDRCDVDVHEMQTLIVVPNGEIVNVQEARVRNGLENNGNEIKALRDAINFEEQMSEGDIDVDDYDTSRRELIASTPTDRRTSASRVTAEAQSNNLNRIELSVEPDADADSSGDASTKKLLLNSNSRRKSNTFDDSIANLNHESNDKLLTKKNETSDSIDDSSFENSQQKLINSTNESSCSSSTSSTGSGGIDAIDRLAATKLSNGNERRLNDDAEETEQITNGKHQTNETNSVVDLNEDTYFQKSLQKWDYRRPIIGPNG